MDNLTQSKIVLDEIFGTQCNTTQLEALFPGIDKTYGPNALCKYNISFVNSLNMEFQAGEVFFQNSQIRIELLFKDVVYDQKYFQFDIHFDQVIFTFGARFGLYNFELKNYILTNFYSENVRGMEINDKMIQLRLQTDLKDDVFRAFNDIGRKPDNRLDLTFLLEGGTRYPKFFGNVIRNSEFDVKHQYIRIRLNNTALVLQNQTEADSEVSPFTHFFLWCLKTLVNREEHFNTFQ